VASIVSTDSNFNIIESPLSSECEQAVETVSHVRLPCQLYRCRGINQTVILRKNLFLRPAELGFNPHEDSVSPETVSCRAGILASKFKALFGWNGVKHGYPQFRAGRGYNHESWANHPNIKKENPASNNMDYATLVFMNSTIRSQASKSPVTDS